VIVVVGDPILRPSGVGAPSQAGGAAPAIARACAAAGATVQLAGKVGDDPAGDEILLTLTRDGIGHVALLRDAGTTTSVGEPAASTMAADDDAAVVADTADADPDGDPDPQPADAASDGARPAAPTSVLAAEDLDLALRYLTSFAVLIVAQPLSAPTLAVAVESAAYSGAHLILIDATEAETAAVAAVPVDDITALLSPASDPEGQFAGLVGRYAAALDGGAAPAAAFRSALGTAGWESATP
jgi:sugar/nucleoside kinase (ribokinase family)